jgi:hypothetical protein
MPFCLLMSLTPPPGFNGSPCVSNALTERLTLVIPLPIASFGTKRIRVRASSSTNIQTICIGIANDSNNNGFDFTEAHSTILHLGPPVLESLDLGNVTVPTGGTLSVECSVPAGGSVQSVDWVP